jgi:uncharacterized protein YciU (UPF0263 family)
MVPLNHVDGVSLSVSQPASSILFNVNTDHASEVELSVHAKVACQEPVDTQTVHVPVVHQVILTAILCALVQVGAIVCDRTSVHDVCFAHATLVHHQDHTVHHVLLTRLGFVIRLEPNNDVRVVILSILSAVIHNNVDHIAIQFTYVHVGLL